MFERLYLGVDIGGTAVKLGLLTEEGSLVDTASYPVNFDGYETPILQTVLQRSREFLSSHTDVVLRAIGVSATGAINSREGIVAGTAGHIKNWLGSRIKEEMSAEFQAPTFVLNDANAAALWEVWLGAAKDRQNVVVVTIGTGVGGGVITDGHILLGRDGFAGHLGHFPIQCEGEACTCGNTGCLEHYASMTALVRMVTEGKEKGKLSFPPEDINGRTIFEEAGRGNEGVLCVIDKWTSYLASGLVGFVHVFNPEMLLLGGGVSAQQELFIRPVREKVLKKAMPNFTRGLVIDACRLGNEAGLVGAVYYTRQNGQ